MKLNEDYLDNIGRDDLEDSIEDYSMEDGYPFALLFGEWFWFEPKYASIFGQVISYSFERFKKMCSKKLAGCSTTDEYVYTLDNEYVEQSPDYFKLMDDDMNAEFGVAPKKYCCIIIHLAPMRRASDLLSILYYALRYMEKAVDSESVRFWDSKNKELIRGHWDFIFYRTYFIEERVKPFYEMIQKYHMVKGDISYEKFLSEVARFVAGHKELSAESSIMDYLPKKKI